MSGENLPVRATIAMGEGGVVLRTIDDLWRMSQMILAAGWEPVGMTKVESICVAIQFGRELGLTPMCALQNIAVINGRPGVYGDALLGVVRSSGLLESLVERYEGSGDDYSAVCTIKRVGEPEAESRFSVADAKRARLWGKTGPWTQYPQRMLKFRARNFGLRDVFPDVLRGFRGVEELADIPEATVTVSQAAIAEPPANGHAKNGNGHAQPQQTASPPPVQTKADVLAERLRVGKKQVLVMPEPVQQQQQQPEPEAAPPAQPANGELFEAAPDHPISKPQKSQIAAWFKQRSMSKDDIEECLSGFNVGAIEQLTFAQAAQLIQQFESMAKQPAPS